ncbi:outer membrane beta-barrel protein [Chryseolinea soli]|uniref:OmpW family protein n=1 Tax=Chryseolinea soli TaxID=2321403 RepID=A0A385SZ03_9BACT|nr:outer membrane beta-barrel protein [Chryseolinea soli]AYB33978.1 OmpW family protein [Chryseolinea soli]
MRKALPIFLLLLVTVVVSRAQQNTFALSYTISFPMGSTSDFLSKTSFRGSTVDWRYALKPNVQIGASVGWYNFYEDRSFNSYTSSDGSTVASGKQYRYINTVPILILADYSFASSDEQKMKPFAGLGIGTTYTRQDTDMGQFTFRDDDWQFTLAPEAGVKIGFQPGFNGYLCARYNNSFSTTYMDTQSYLSLNIGMAIDF